MCLLLSSSCQWSYLLPSEAELEAELNDPLVVDTALDL